MYRVPQGGARGVQSAVWQWVATSHGITGCGGERFASDAFASLGPLGLRVRCGLSSRRQHLSGLPGAAFPAEEENSS